MTNKFFSGRVFRQVTITGLAIVIALWAATAHAGTPPWTQINNLANVSYQDHGVDKDPVPSNIASVTVPLYRTPAAIEFLKWAPQLDTATLTHVERTYYSNSGARDGSYRAMDTELPRNVVNPVPLTGDENFHIGEPLFIQVTDLDQNLDPAERNTILVGITSTSTGDSEWLRLTETDVSTGTFVGYILSNNTTPQNGNGTLSAGVNERLVATYIDPLDDEPTVTDAALVDPYGIVFDSTSGQPVDGATITLIDTSTNSPANVYGDDGTSSFPSTLTSGGEATDSSGATYNFPPGGYRFPLIDPGNYRLEITSPAGYANHTTTADFPVLQQLPGGPFALIDASIGEPFAVNPGPAIRIDVPVDPAPVGLWLTKTADLDIVSAGDFLQYRLTLENLSDSIAAADIVINDRLPLGFRYQKGSLRINGSASSNPTIGDDGREMRLETGTVEPQERVEITYVVEVGAGAKPGKAKNLAQAESGGISSNVASATVTVKPAFFTNTTFLAGRVLSGGCDEPDTAMEGLGGVRIYLEDGTYVLTDQQGRYHFEGVEPGVHVVQADTSSLPIGYQMIPCEESSQFAGRTFSQFVDLQGGTLWRVNFYASPKPAPSGDIRLRMSSSLEDSLADFVIDLTANNIPISNLRLTVMLPGQSTYQPGTSTRNGTGIEDPQDIAGAVTFRIPTLDADQPMRLAFQANLAGDSTSEELPAKALLMFDTPAAKNQRTPVVETLFQFAGEEQPISEELKLYPHFPSFVADLQPTDTQMLEQLVEQLSGQQITRVDIVGHTDNKPIARRSRHIFADNMALSQARAESFANYLQQHLEIPGEAITTRGMGDSMPVAENDSSSGRALNRRVDLYLVSAKVESSRSLSLAKGSSQEESVATSGLSPVDAAATETPHVANGLVDEPVIDDTWLAQATPQARLVWPAPGYVPLAPSTSVMVQYANGQQMNVTLNGEKINPLNFDGVKSNANGIRVAIWKGVDLKYGKNIIEAVVTDNDEQEILRTTREVWYVEEPYHVRLIPEKSVLLADGLNSPVLALQLTDAAGHPVRPGVDGTFRVNPPYQPVIDNEFDTVDISTTEPSEAHVRTGAHGIALAKLEPTTQSGEVVLRIPLAEGAIEEVRAWLKPAPRDWILVGFAEGTMGYNSFSGNQVSLEEAGIDEHFYDDGQVKFFAKGAVKGEWLLTMAYDSDKPDLDGDTLYQAIDPDEYYPLYGDGTQQGYEASSAHNIYIKLEKDQFYALFGDMNTGLNQTELSRYNRSMSGFKAEQLSYNISYTLFAADTKQAFIKDELRGDGTSGRYALSQKDMVLNSEEVTLETRDRFRSDIIIETETLQRHVDYDIDYDNGTLFFKRPVPSKDQEFNPIYIVVRYETEDSDDENFNYGGRAAVKILDQKIEVGGSYIHEDRGAGEGDLYGADATIKLTPRTTVKLETAHTETEFEGEDHTDNAHLAELHHDGERFKGRTYFREQGEEFGLGQQNASESGTRKYGAEASYHFTPKFSVASLVYREKVLSSGNKRDVAEIDGRYQAERFGLHSGFRHAKDRLGDGSTKRSEQILFGGNLVSADTKLNLRADHEQSLSSRNKNVDYPTRTIVGLDYRLNEKITTFAEQEFTWGKDQDTEGTRVGLNATPWQGGDVRTTVERQMTENSQRVFALFGLGQTWQANQNWSFDANLDRSYTIKSDNDYQFNEKVPTTQGSNDDFTSVSVGATYRVAHWTWWNRLETRQADSEDKYGVSTSLVGEPQDGVAVSAKALAFITNSTKGSKRSEQEVRFGMAYRPNKSRWIILDRLDVYFDRLENDFADGYNNWRIINHLHANYHLNRKWQVSFYYGLKYVRDNIAGTRYDGFTDMISIETRYNLNARWDLGVHGSILHSWNSETLEYSAGADVGYSPVTNAWVSLGYNLVGFEDDDFDAAHYTAQGAYMRFRMKFDQQSVKEAAKWMNR